jgi:hypothetical protein
MSDDSLHQIIYFYNLMFRVNAKSPVKLKLSSHKYLKHNPELRNTEGFVLKTIHLVTCCRLVS